jgi:DNA-binding transcriptional ArsR family regulator
MEDYKSLQNELSFPVRMGILENLSQKPMKLNDISKNYSLSKSEISRHLSRLLEIKVIKKDDDRTYSVTPLGEAFINLLLPVNFLLSYHDFFENHYFDLPISNYRFIDNLSKAELISGIGNVLTTVQNILSETESQIKIVLDQKFPVGITGRKIDSGKYVVPRELLALGVDYVKKVYIHFEVKTHSPINHTILISDEKVAVISFPDLKHKADVSACFLVKDSEGVNYLTEIFNNYWNQGIQVTV